jgi:hypothetical protein
MPQRRVKGLEDMLKLIVKIHRDKEKAPKRFIFRVIVMIGVSAQGVYAIAGLQGVLDTQSSGGIPAFSTPQRAAGADEPHANGNAG